MVGTHVDGFPRGFGPYLLLASFGRGGMGEVFLAKRRVLDDVDRLCVVKTIRGDLAESREYVTRFLDEARLAVQLSHPHICQVYEAQRVGTDHCLAMEYIPGVNLRELVHDVLARNERIDEGSALYLVEAVLDALSWAHDFTSPTSNEHLRIVHRDVSPANVMVGFDGEVKLIDFGLAESVLKQEQTETRLVMGKVAYMAPEQARGEDVTGAVDQFAAAVMLVELLVGERFYGGWNPHQIWQVVGVGGHRPASFASLPGELRAVLDRALAPRAQDRFPTCEAFARALAEVRVRRAPTAGKHTLRERMRALYGDRAAATRDLIGSFADLRAPPLRDTIDVTGSLPRTPGAGPGASQMTDPWQTSPSRPADVPLPPQRPLAVESPTPEVTHTSRVPHEGTATVARAALPSPRAPLVAGLGIAAVVAVAAFLGTRSAQTVEAVDAGTVVAVAPVVDAGATAPVDAVPVSVDAGSEALVDAGGTATEAASVVEKPPVRRPLDKPAEKPIEKQKPIEKPPVVEPPPVLDAPPPLERELTWDAAADIVRACDAPCAKEWLPKLDVPAKGPEDAKARLGAIKLCVKRCTSN